MGRVIAHEPNPYETISEALNDIFEDDYVTSRCQRITADKQTTPTN
jgi:hypothetical protein